MISTKDMSYIKCKKIEFSSIHPIYISNHYLKFCGSKFQMPGLPPTLFGTLRTGALKHTTHEHQPKCPTSEFFEWAANLCSPKKQQRVKMKNTRSLGCPAGT